MYYVIFPRGDESRISVANIEDYEVEDYLLASRQSFPDEQLIEAYRYARALAQANNLTLENANMGKEDRQEVAYLD